MLSAAEQLLIEMINRMRLDPLGEADRFGINLNEGLEPGTLDGSARQVLAPNELLNNAAEGHAVWMLEEDRFSHTGDSGSSPAERMMAAGYEFSGRHANGENITYQGSTGSIDLNSLMEENHHKDFFLSAGHRANMLHDFYREIGVSQTEGVFTSGGRDFNASMVVENFALSGASVFLTGVSYNDSDNDDFYSIGEGRGGVQVQASGQSTQTKSAGGYAIALTAASDVAVTLGGIGLRVDLSGGNGKLDLVGAGDVTTSVDTTLTTAAGSLTALGVGDIDLTGHAGADVLVGNKGDNILDGGAGHDRVVFDLDFADVTLRQTQDAITVVTAGLGTDTLRNIETVVFNDQTLNFAFAPERTTALSDIARTGDLFDGDWRDDVVYADGFAAGLAEDVSAQIYRLYQAALGRTPDRAGHADWTEQVFEGDLTLSDVAGRFVLSTEFNNTYGAVDTGGFVDLMFQNVLGRPPAESGRAAWVSAIEGGMTRADAVLGFSQSQEFINNTAALATRFTVDHTPQDWSDDVFRLYRATLDRAPQEAGFTHWVETLSRGVDFTNVVSGFVDSNEFQLVYGPLDNESFVEVLYRNVLDRGADAVGLAHWLDILESGSSRGEIVESFIQSREFVRNSSDDVTSWIRAQGTDDVIAAGGGENVLSGGLMSDMFVFEANVYSTHEVLDLEAWDTLNFEGFGYENAGDLRAHLSEVGGNATFADQNVAITFKGASLSDITDDMFLL